jgi:exopolysaccharide biosynthesis polyprenyl glycosylphosphotransferase
MSILISSGNKAASEPEWKNSMREGSVPMSETGHPVARTNILKAARGLLHRHWRTAYVGVIILGDAAAILLAGAAAYIIREMIPDHSRMTPGDAARVAIPAAAFSISIAFLTGLYRSAYRTSYTEQYREAIKAYLYSTVLVFFSLHMAMGLGFPPRFTLFFLALIPLFFGVIRWLLNYANRGMQRLGHGQENTLIVNWHGAGAQLLDRFTIFPELGYKVKAFICASGDRATCDAAACTLQQHFDAMQRTGIIPTTEPLPCHPLRDIRTAINEHRIECMFVPLLKTVTGGFAEIVQACMKAKIELKVVSSESELLLRFSRVKDIAGVTLYAPPKRLTRKLRVSFKRAFDVCASGLLILLCSPILAVVAAAILIEDGRPVLFRQRRSSMKGGKYFSVLKFRSMVKDAETRQAELNKINQTEGGLFLLKRDPRVTRVGELIRRYSIDELPQLFNVFRGEMSLVGPRPLAISDLQNVSEENDYAGYYYLRDRAKPGMTGLWQICGRREVPFREMVLLDLYYIDNQSVMFDLEILFATIPVVLFGRGAY